MINRIWNKIVCETQLRLTSHIHPHLQNNQEKPPFMRDSQRRHLLGFICKESSLIHREDGAESWVIIVAKNLDEQQLTTGLFAIYGTRKSCLILFMMAVAPWSYPHHQERKKTDGGQEQPVHCSEFDLPSQANARGRFDFVVHTGPDGAV